MTDDQFSRAFKDLVPDSPSPDGWAAGALRRRRNRNVAFAGVAAALVLAVGVPAGMNLADPRIVANPADTPSPEIAPQPAAQGSPGAAECYDDDGNPVMGAQTEVELRDGAVRAWLCGDAVTGDSFGTAGPLEPLVEGVEEITSFVADQPQLDMAAIMCTADYSLSYKVVLEYDDGSTEIVNAETHGCQSINYGTTYREGGVEFLELLQGLWSDQRAGVEMPTQSAPLPSCPPPNGMLVPTLDDITAGIVCREENSLGSAPLEPEEVARIVEEIRNEAVEEQPSDWGPTNLVLVSGWGDWLGLAPAHDGASYWFTDAEGVAWTWTPSPELAELIDAAIARIPRTNEPPVIEPPVVAPTGEGVPGDPGDPVAPVDPEPSGEPVVGALYEPEGCVGVQDGSVTTAELPGGALPDDPAVVWLCGKGIEPGGSGGPVGPLEPLTTAPQNAVNLYNSLPVADFDACTDDFGPSYFVIHEYADGSRLPVEIQTYGCKAVATGADQKSGGVDYLDALLALWNDQRAAGGDAVAERPGPICPWLSSILPVAPAEGFVAGWACNDRFAEDASEVQLPPELVAATAEQLAASSYSSDGSGAPDLDSLVFLNRHGDPLTLERLEDGTYRWWDGQQAMVWEPPSAIAEQLNEYLPA